MSSLWIIFVSLLQTSINLQCQNQGPVLYFGNVPVSNHVYYTNCAPQVSCDPSSVYRTINGSCNNLANPQWGASMTPFLRLSEGIYADGDYQLRRQVDGSELPGARELQIVLFLDRAVDYPDTYNFHINQLAQWFTHDITLLPPDFGAQPADCCDVFPINQNTPVACTAAIEIPPWDPVYGENGRTCMHFKRAMTSSRNFNCNISPQIPYNQATALIDASQLYGHTQAKANQLRTFSGGKLTSDFVGGQEFCPQRQRNGSLVCDERSNVQVCFDGGDPRTNQHFGITLYHTMFLRFHNMLTDRLRQLNPRLSDEDLYQGVRRFMGAISQIMTYRDILPVLLGRDYTESTGLALQDGIPTVYDSTLHPQLSIEFTASGFRVPHNILPSIYTFTDENYNEVNSFKLNEWMSISDPLLETPSFDNLLRGMTQKPGRAPLPSYNFLISNYMHRFIFNGNQDLLAVDIQRGRDCGLPPYNVVREMCGLQRASSFEDFADVIPISDVRKLESLYLTVDDVDLHVGSLLEKLCPDAMVGFTARCLIGDVFHRARFGDRFFFDVREQPGSFSRAQLEALKMINLGHVFCAGTDVKQMPYDVYRAFPEVFPAMLNCQEVLTELDFIFMKATQ